MIEFDPDKDARNIAMRGISLAEAEKLFEGLVLRRIDDRRDYDEIRIAALGEISGKEFVCIYTMRGDVIRVISLRPANRKERNDYRKAKAARDTAA
jgi:uncharacterized protein